MDSETIDSILAEAARKHGVTVEEIKGRSQLREFCVARAEAMKELYELGLTMRAIGEILGNRRPTTVYGYLRTAWTP
jgi:chromosomal replication initiation ATPase DnaA